MARIYTGADNPYSAWLQVTDQKKEFARWLGEHLPHFNFVTDATRPVSILDMGCNSGNVSLRLMDTLRRMRISFNYTGADPSPEQLQSFVRLAQAAQHPRPHLFTGTVESFVPLQMYDLVLASHLLYYATDLREALRRLTSAGREILIVHHGRRGINQFHEAFPEVVAPGPNIISTDDQIAHLLAELPLNGQTVERHRLTSTVDLSACLDPNTRQGQNLLAFFFERDYDTIPPRDLRRIRAFLAETFGPKSLMTHEDSIFVVRETRTSARPVWERVSFYAFIDRLAEISNILLTFCAIVV